MSSQRENQAGPAQAGRAAFNATDPSDRESGQSFPMINQLRFQGFRPSDRDKLVDALKEHNLPLPEGAATTA
jgi:hypothetical protein